MTDVQSVQGVTPVWTPGDRVHKARQVAGLTLEQLASRSGLSKPTLWRYEHGVTTPRARQLRAIAAATGVDVAWLAVTDGYLALARAIRLLPHGIDRAVAA